MAEYQTKIIQRGVCTITILRPVLTTAERSKREQNVRVLLERTLKDYYTRKDMNV